MITIILSILGWFATICRAIGMFVKGDKKVKTWTTLGNLGFLLVGLIQWLALDLSITLALSNALCIGVFIYSRYNNK